jgi:TonB-dependent receptor
VLDSVVVQKSVSADMPGEFGGGTVMLRTKEATDKTFFKAAVGTGFQDGTTFKDGLRYQGGSRDWLGFDRVRELPSAVSSLSIGNAPFRPSEVTPEQREAAGESLAALGLNTRKENTQPNGTLSAAAGTGLELGGQPWSVLGAFRLSNQWEANVERRRQFIIRDEDPVAFQDIRRDVTERQGALSAFINVVGNVAEGHRIQANSMLLRQSTDQAQIDEGFNDNPEEISRSTELEWIENSLISNQLGGEHYFSNFYEITANWQVTDARASRDSPAKRRYRYDQIDGQFQFSNTSDNNQISYEDLDDESRECRASIVLPWLFSENTASNFSLGASILDKDRTSGIRRFLFASQTGLDTSTLRLSPEQIFSAQNIRPGGFELREITRTLDNYVAEQALDALFFNSDWTFGTDWRLAFGVRREKNSQRVSTFDIGSPSSPPIIGSDDQTDWLPSLAGTYIFDEGQQQLRASLTRSLSRPDFREYSPSAFLDPILDIESFGNPDLVPTKIDNLDLRWERYFDGDESISAALFYKRFDKPIERVVIGGTGGILSFENADSATNIGVEVEGFIRLGRFSEKLGDFYASSNVSFIKSDVKLGASGAVQTNRNRALQGQSEYLANIQIGYKPEDSKFDANLLYNVSGPRVSQVGAFGLNDIFEEPFHQLDFTARYKITDLWNFSFRARNLLDQEVEFTRDNLPTRIYQPGREFAVNFEFSF